jgi:2-polyprenyl-6-methoxyphenol hydroxylase-like FAD-dependent oxidoreductase
VNRRQVEIVGAGFAGLAAACALGLRGWKVRVHERADALRTAGAGIYIYENGLRVLEALNAYDAAVVGAQAGVVREVRDQHDRLISSHRWGGQTRVVSVARQQVINALADSARRIGCEIITNSEATGVMPTGELCFSNGNKIRSDLIIAADGVNSKVRDSVELLQSRTPLPDGAIRLLIDKSAQEIAAGPTGKTIEYWSGSRRILYTPCSDRQLYVCLTMLDADSVATTVPPTKEAWKKSFPKLSPLIDRLDAEARYDRFEVIKLKRWSKGNVAIIGDAAHALPPNIGQGAGCGMMNALSLAVFLDECSDIRTALLEWEERERPLTEHTQRVSVIMGRPTNWPPKLRAMFFWLAGRSKWAVEQRTRTARHRPLGTSRSGAIASKPDSAAAFSDTPEITYRLENPHAGSSSTSCCHCR